MAHGPDIRALTDSVIEDFYDPGSIRRGTAYAAEHRVTVLSVEPGAAAGIVEGSSRTPYLVRLDWQHDPIGIDIVDSCSCPLGGECKRSGPDTHRPWHLVSASASPDWRSALSAIVADVDGDRRASGEPLALEVAVSSPKRSTCTRPRGPTPQVTLRPLRMGRSGRWIKTGVCKRPELALRLRIARQPGPHPTVGAALCSPSWNIGYDLEYRAAPAEPVRTGGVATPSASSRQRHRTGSQAVRHRWGRRGHAGTGLDRRDWR